MRKKRRQRVSKTDTNSVYIADGGDVAGMVQTLRDMADMLQSGHLKHVSGGLKATPFYMADADDGFHVFQAVRISSNVVLTRGITTNDQS